MAAIIQFVKVHPENISKLCPAPNLADIKKSGEPRSPEIQQTRRNLKIDQDEPKQRAYLALEDELERERALAGEIGVALKVVDAGLQHPRLVENRETRRFVVQAGDEVVGAVRPELHL